MAWQDERRPFGAKIVRWVRHYEGTLLEETSPEHLHGRRGEGRGNRLQWPLPCRGNSLDRRPPPLAPKIYPDPLQIWDPVPEYGPPAVEQGYRSPRWPSSIPVKMVGLSSTSCDA